MAENGELTKAEFSSRFFGSKHRIDIMGLIGGFSIDPPQVFTVLKDIEPVVGASPAFLWKEIDNLVVSGLITEIERGPWKTRQFVRNDICSGKYFKWPLSPRI